MRKQSIKSRILRMLYGKPRTCAQVAKKLDKTPAYTWQYLNRYTRVGLLCKERDADGGVTYETYTSDFVAQPEPADFTAR